MTITRVAAVAGQSMIAIERTVPRHSALCDAISIDAEVALESDDADTTPFVCAVSVPVVVCVRGVRTW